MTEMTLITTARMLYSR